MATSQKLESSEFLPITFDAKSRISCFSAQNDPPAHVSRGTLLALCLSGDASYEVVKPICDEYSGDDQAEIDYTPDGDFRLDKFDAVEYGFSMIDSSSTPGLAGSPLDEKRRSEEKE